MSEESVAPVVSEWQSLISGGDGDGPSPSTTVTASLPPTPADMSAIIMPGQPDPPSQRPAETDLESNGGTSTTASTPRTCAPAKVGFTQLPPTDSMAPTLMCQDCHLKVDPAAKGTRLRSKSKMEFQCGKCSSKVSAMAREHGAWPTDEYKKLPEQSQIDFMRQGGGHERVADQAQPGDFETPH